MTPIALKRWRKTLVCCTGAIVLFAAQDANAGWLDRIRGVKVGATGIAIGSYAVHDASVFQSLKKNSGKLIDFFVDVMDVVVEDGDAKLAESVWDDVEKVPVDIVRESIPVFRGVGALAEMAGRVKDRLRTANRHIGRFVGETGGVDPRSALAIAEDEEHYFGSKTGVFEDEPFPTVQMSTVVGASTEQSRAKTWREVGSRDGEQSYEHVEPSSATESAAVLLESRELYLSSLKSLERLWAASRSKGSGPENLASEGYQEELSSVDWPGHEDEAEGRQRVPNEYGDDLDGESPGGNVSIALAHIAEVSGGSNVTSSTLPNESNTTATDVADEHALRLSGIDRRWVQIALKDAGFDPGRPDGIFGPRTRRALEAWQSANGLEPTGQLTRDQADVLIADSAMHREEEVQDAKDKEAEIYVKHMVPAGVSFRDCDACPEMMVVPAGSFEMGSPFVDADSERPVHRVTITEPIAVGKFEVTREEFWRFVSETGYSAGNSCLTHEDVDNISWWGLRDGRHWQNPGFQQTKRDPVVCVNWNDAKAYTSWLSQRTGENYRLLSESEWEYAARGGTNTRFFWGEDWDEQCAYANSTDESVKKIPHGDWNLFPARCNDGYIYTSPVGTFAPNGFGLHDMTGNVWEWVEDCWHDNYSGAPFDGSAWTTESDCRKMVLRGNSWFSIYAEISNQMSFRTWSNLSDRIARVGFRLARTLSTGIATGTLGETQSTVAYVSDLPPNSLHGTAKVGDIDGLR